MATAAERKSQEESEQPAKVYQLDALGEQVAGIASQMKEGFTQVNSSVNALLIKSESQVTPQQLNDNIAALKTTLENQITEEVKKIHLTYKPLKDNNKWLIRAIASQGIIIVGQILFIAYVSRGI